MKNSNDTIGNRTYNLLACSTVPQPTAPPRALADPIWLQKITTDTSLLINVECLDDVYPKLKIYISKLILGSYKYIPVVYVTALHDLTLLILLHGYKGFLNLIF